eukprot:CAMPEP_0175046038 /NCGR_PEP_ID=MMETSP0052_2-20121109/4800_1 /TAXON_ID=51329 ORGANISM="Polytomella parva, Strain SAG 63-3" /NCGR_SAMPLE_ID=MMETSP0052_2 /ASSEMBLY_ACC=CAM_ASM_000194 /LENGTH=342 /DNA_ID=CAMNT_0016309723 /DNA_START=33 /DNA_END=1061 /DNA_ORIENTATION=+
MSSTSKERPQLKGDIITSPSTEHDNMINAAGTSEEGGRVLSNSATHLQSQTGLVNLPKIADGSRHEFGVNGGDAVNNYSSNGNKYDDNKYDDNKYDDNSHINNLGPTLVTNSRHPLPQHESSHQGPTYTGFKDDNSAFPGSEVHPLPINNNRSSLQPFCNRPTSPLRTTTLSSQMADGRPMGNGGLCTAAGSDGRNAPNAYNGIDPKYGSGTESQSHENGALRNQNYNSGGDYGNKNNMYINNNGTMMYSQGNVYKGEMNPQAIHSLVSVTPDQHMMMNRNNNDNCNSNNYGLNNLYVQENVRNANNSNGNTTGRQQVRMIFSIGVNDALEIASEPSDTEYD